MVYKNVRCEKMSVYDVHTIKNITIVLTCKMYVRNRISSLFLMLSYFELKIALSDLSNLTRSSSYDKTNPTVMYNICSII